MSFLSWRAGPLPPGFKYIEYNDINSLRQMVLSVNSQAVYGKTGIISTVNTHIYIYIYIHIYIFVYILMYVNDHIGLAAIMLEPLQGEGGIRPGI